MGIVDGAMVLATGYASAGAYGWLARLTGQKLEADALHMNAAAACLDSAQERTARVLVDNRIPAAIKKMVLSLASIAADSGGAKLVHDLLDNPRADVVGMPDDKGLEAALGQLAEQSRDSVGATVLVCRELMIAMVLQWPDAQGRVHLLARLASAMDGEVLTVACQAVRLWLPIMAVRPSVARR